MQGGGCDGIPNEENALHSVESLLAAKDHSQGKVMSVLFSDETNIVF